MSFSTGIRWIRYVMLLPFRGIHRFAKKMFNSKECAAIFTVILIVFFAVGIPMLVKPRLSTVRMVITVVLILLFTIIGLFKFEDMWKNFHRFFFDRTQKITNLCNKTERELGMISEEPKARKERKERKEKQKLWEKAKKIERKKAEYKQRMQEKEQKSNSLGNNEKPKITMDDIIKKDNYRPQTTLKYIR